MSKLIRYNFLLLLLLSLSQLSAQPIDPAEEWASAKLKLMSLDEKIGQLFMIRAHSDKGPEHIKSIEDQIKKYKVGGLCFFQGTPTKQAELTNKYQRLTDTPLLISIDGEWGLGMRFKKNSISFPKQLTLGAVSDNTLIYEMGQSVASHLKRIGVNLNFAPVIDVNNNPDNPVIHNRSFGESMFSVATKSYAYVKGMQDGGIYACMKHFPGHGDTDVDSHYDLPVISHSKKRLDSLELMPFRVLSQLGVKSAMTAHLSIPALDPEPNRPTSLSRKVVTGILKDQLHFEGLIITDALEMQGVAKHFKPGDMELEALKAGNDILLLPIDIKTAVEKLKSEVQTQRLDEAIIDQRVMKILKAKYDLGLTGKPYIKNLSLISRDVNDQASLTLKKKLYQKALTLVKDDKKLVPIKNLGTHKIASLSLGHSKGKSDMQKMLSNYGITAQHYVGKEISAEKVNQLKVQLAKYETIIISLHDLSISSKKDFGISKSMFDIIYELNSRQNIILVNNGSPYALKYFRMIPTIIQAYEEDKLMQEVTAQAIFGSQKIEGKLPVTAHEDFPVGAGITRPSMYRLGYATPEEVLMSSDSLDEIDTIVQEMFNKKAAPGCQILAARAGKVFYHKAFGYHTDKKQKKVKLDDVYDVASVTKILATTISMMKLYDEGKLNTNHKLSQYLPELDTTNKGNLIIEDVLAHHSGLPGWIPFYEDSMEKEVKNPKRLEKYYRPQYEDTHTLKVTDKLYLRNDFKDTIYRQIYNCDLRTSRNYKYSDLGFYLFDNIIRNLSGKPLDVYANENFYTPLGLHNTTFNPLRKIPKERIPPSEKDDYFRDEVIHGHVHDMGAAMLGGVSGHAGLFSNAQDLAVLMQMLLNGGSYGATRFISPQTIRKFTTRYHRSTRRGLGFDMKQLDSSKTENTCEEASDQAFGHLGFTGISVFADPKYDLIYIFLSNRTYPTMENWTFSKNNYRPRIQSVFYKAMMDDELN